MKDRPVRTLVVDDSAFARKVLRESLSRYPEIELVGIARDGLEALEKIAELSPDVITLDLVMPNLDGLGVLRALAGAERPKVVVVSTSDAESELGIEALEHGAVEVVHKPTATANDRLYELSGELAAAVLSAAQARLRKVVPSRSPPFEAPISTTGKTEIVVVGTSTGGPQALTRLLTALPEDFPVPIAMVLHIPVGYTEALARRLDALSKLDVREATEGLRLRPGLAVLAKAGEHLEIVGRGSDRVARLTLEPADVPHRPSVDVLFRSAAAEYKSAALGIVLTGMGDDGLEGSRLIHAAGGRILAEAESSSIVYGMPRCVHDAGLAEAEAPIEEMAALLVRSL
ncbi:MAG: chemotaxis-specific protein-glutamate methyltransferase CheB [Myxococcales bacterium]